MEQNIILFTPSISGGGAEKVTADLASMFAKKRFNTTLICIYKKQKDQFNLEKKVNIIYLNYIKIIFSIYKLFNLLFPVIERTDEFCNFLDNFFAKYIATEIY